MTVPAAASLPAPEEGDFLALLQNLLPRGRAWSRDPDTVQAQVLSGFALAQADARARQVALPVDAFPITTEELVPEWEATLGLPDPCLGSNPIMAARKAAIDARIAATGGQSVAYFEQLAVNLGGEISITEYAPFRIGIDVCGAAIRTPGWAHCWLVTLTTGAIFYFECGVSTCGEPLWQVANGPIQCEIQRLAPGQTVIEFDVAPDVPVSFFQADADRIEGVIGVS